jgi:hypothetical protein
MTDKSDSAIHHPPLLSRFCRHDSPQSHPSFLLASSTNKMVSVPARFMQPVVGLRVTVLSYTDHPRPVLLLWQGHR